jgi:hypothetical protein
MSGQHLSVPAEGIATVPPIKAVYEHLDSLLSGIVELKKAGYRKNMTVTTPFPRHEVDELLYEGEPSPVRWFTLVGGLTGATLAFSLASLTHANWPMILPGGKPVVSIPAFLVITFEGTILWASLLTFTGMMLFCKLPARDLPKAVEDPRFSNDRFGIVLSGLGTEDEAKVRHILEHSGAEEVSGGANAEGGHHD